jgi:hypothetical protein
MDCIRRIVMKKTLLAALTLGSVALGGCVAVPVYDEPAYYGPPPVVVQPSIGFSYYHHGYYGPRHRHWRHRHR